MTFFEYTPLGLIGLAVGYLFTTRPSTRECDARHHSIDNDLDWLKGAVWGLVQKNNVDVSPPPKRNEGTK